MELYDFPHLGEDQKYQMCYDYMNQYMYTIQGKRVMYYELTDKERFVLDQREKGSTFVKIGEQIGLSGNRASQIYRQANRKIKRQDYQNKVAPLKEFVYEKFPEDKGFHMYVFLHKCGVETLDDLVHLDVDNVAVPGEDKEYTLEDIRKLIADLRATQNIK